MTAATFDYMRYSLATTSDRDPDAGLLLAIERPPSLARKAVELMFYLSFGNSTFLPYTGLEALEFASGGTVALFGLLAFIISTFQGERLNMTFKFIILMTVTGTVTALSLREPPIIGDTMKPFTHWIANAAMLFYVVRNQAASRRVMLYISVALIFSVVLGGVQEGGRLNVEEVGAAFSNSNRLAYSCGMFSVALLFWSLRSGKLIRPLLWALAAIIVYYLFLTVSRGGILAWACGMAVLAVAVLLGRGVRIAGIMLVLVSLAIGSRLAVMVADSSHYLEERAHERSMRLDVYSVGTLHDLARTTVLGRGTGAGNTTSAGIESHNSFLYTHMVYGGITAWPYLAWMIILSIRVKRMVLSSDFPLDVRMQVLALFGMGLASQLLSNAGYQFISTIYATAVIEKYTAPYSRARIMERQLGFIPQSYSGYGS